jgi:RNA polymerase sigma-70 factor (ECF subfamily)
VTELREDADLLAAHLDGDRDAFAELVRRHRDKLWAVALRTTGDREDAADAVQDALMSAFRRAESFRGDAQVSTWLHRIVVNACLDRMRHHKSHHTEALPEEEDRVGVLADKLPYDDPAAASERRTDVMNALGELTEDQRVALVLVDMEGYTVEEVAEIVGCAPGTVKSRCARGRSRLAPLLAQYRRNQPANGDVQAQGSPPSSRGGSQSGAATPTPESGSGK